MRATALLAVLVVSSLLGAGCLRRPDVAPGASNAILTLHHGMLDRSYILHSPPQAATGEPLPLLLMLHGGFASARHMQAKYGMDAQSDALGFYVAYPDGVGRTWNAMHCCGAGLAGHVDDVGFLAALVSDVAATHAIDPQRIGIAGHSNGAMMAYRFAAERSDRVASVMAVAGTVGGQEDDTAPVVQVPVPAHSVHVLDLHATDDPNVPYGGGHGTSGINDERIDLAVSVSEAFWLKADGLQDAQPTSTAIEGVFTDTYGNLPGPVVTFIATEGGHGWPGRAKASLTGVTAPARPDATALVATFLMDHPRPV